MAEKLAQAELAQAKRALAATTDLSQLEAAAEREDKHLFAALVRAIRWQERTPNDFLRAIRLAFELEIYSFAAALAQRGTEWFPSDPRIQRLAYVFGPPRMIGAAPARPRLAASLQWLSQHSTKYRGQWVAVHDGKLIAAAPTRAGLTPQLPADISRTEILIARVLNA